jgi:hypothetical protein
LILLAFGGEPTGCHGSGSPLRRKKIFRTGAACCELAQRVKECLFGWGSLQRSGSSSSRMKPSRRLNRLVATFTETFGLGCGVAIATILLVAGAVLFALFWFFHSAPPPTIVITSGPASNQHM